MASSGYDGRVAEGSRDNGRIAAVYDALRREILSGRLAPGARLKPSDFAADLDVSAPVVREALVRLAGERLVVGRPNRGFSVISLTHQELEQHTEARVLIDQLAIRLAIERGDLDWQSDIVAALYRLQATPIRLDDPQPRISDDWAANHAAFHRALVAGCGNDFLLDLRQQLADTSDMLIRWAVVATPEQNGEDDEHRRLADAVLAHDYAAAAELIATHYRRTADRLRPMLPSKQERR